MQTSTTITLTPDEVKGAIIESLLRLGYSAKPDQIVLQCTMASVSFGTGLRPTTSTVPVFNAAVIRNPESIKRE